MREIFQLQPEPFDVFLIGNHINLVHLELIRKFCNN
jgi:hypothetical protein